ncbi:MAG: hypothetical protein COA32_12780 [Fluviicola sp.]|nr:MAG: hypothetical protein COA32_12780 [Fluviicola sp.]
MFLAYSTVELLAQEETETIAKIKYNPFKTTIEDQDDIWEVKFGSTHLLPTSNSIQSKKFAFRFGIHYFYEINFSPAKRFALAIGLGYNFQQLKTKGIFEGSPDATFTPAENINNLSNPRLNIHELNFPLELRLKFQSELKFYLAYNFTIPVSNNMKYKVDGDDFNEKNTTPINAFQHGPSLRVGYKDFFLFTRYNVSSLFLTPEFESVELFSFGISLGG